ncbi:MAG: ADP-heptose:LPS heptosyltransferase [Candidatus Omnitrophota bacterium]|jgi:ADP-heptose:LPS heptosyltransferase
MKKILIVKLGAMGDVLRTTPLLLALKREHPNSHITWIVEDICAFVLEDNDLIDDLWIYSKATMDKLADFEFDLAFNLDKEPEALESITKAIAIEKKGFGAEADGVTPRALTPSSNYALTLGVDDELKFRLNKKTYQQISYEQVDLPYENDPYLFGVNDEDKQYAKDHLAKLGYDRKTPIIGINTGSGERFAGKRLPAHSIIELAKRLHKKHNSIILLLGGPTEAQINIDLAESLKGIAINAGTNHSIQQFAGLVDACGIIITGDTIAMHIAIAMQTKLLVFFGSTCPAEIELYGLGQKIISDLDCAPCYKKTCPIDEKCMSDFLMEDFESKVDQILVHHPNL